MLTEAPSCGRSLHGPSITRTPARGHADEGALTESVVDRSLASVDVVSRNSPLGAEFLQVNGFDERRDVGLGG